MTAVLRIGWLLGLTVAFISPISAQPPDLQWSHIYNFSPYDDIDDGRCVYQTADGGYAITGACVPDGMVSHVDVLLVKTDEAGASIWSRSYGIEYIDEGLAVEQTADGGYIIGGRALFITGSIPALDHQSDIWLIKTDSQGDTLWTRLYGDEGHDYCTSIHQCDDGGYILTGTTGSEQSYPNYDIGPGFLPDTSHVWLLKTDANGDTSWTRTYFSRSHGHCVAATADGGHIITGWIFPDENDDQSDVLLIKTDAFGDTLWTGSYGGADYELGLSVQPVSDGYVIAGQVNYAAADCDALLMKTDLSGNLLWTETYGGNLNDGGRSLAVAPDGGFYLTGSANGIIWFSPGDIWVVRIDAEGNLQWEETYNPYPYNYGWNGITANDGSLVFTGMTSPGFGGYLWLAKLEPEPGAVNDLPVAPLSFRVGKAYPNPFNPTTTITFDLPVACQVNLQVFDMQGRSVTSHQSPVTSHYAFPFDGSNLSSGIYIYRLSAGEFSGMGKMVLLK